VRIGRSLKRAKEKSTTNGILSCEVNENVKRLKTVLGDSSDLSIRMIESPHDKSVQAAVIHLDGLADATIINENIVEPLIDWFKENKQIFSEIEERASHILTVSQLSVKESWQEFISAVLTGDTVVLLNGSTKAFIASTKSQPSRAITEPTSQTVIRGPKDSFTENLRTNTSLIRARVQNPDVRLVSLKVGSVTQTDIAVMYIQGIADESIVEEVKKRVQGIDIDGVLESNYIEELIRDDSATIFPLLLNTERPDAVVGNMLEGRIAIIIQGTPFVLIVPAIFSQFFQSPEDYYQNQYISSFLRMLSFFSIDVCIRYLFGTNYSSPGAYSYYFTRQFNGSKRKCPFSSDCRNTGNGNGLRDFTGGRNSNAKGNRTSCINCRCTYFRAGSC
jgi:spore germination protein KA